MMRALMDFRLDLGIKNMHDARSDGNDIRAWT
jgi:hypothetical protein